MTYQIRGSEKRGREGGMEGGRERGGEEGGSEQLRFFCLLPISY